MKLKDEEQDIPQLRPHPDYRFVFAFFMHSFDSIHMIYTAIKYVDMLSCFCIHTVLIRLCMMQGFSCSLQKKTNVNNFTLHCQIYSPV